MSSSVPPFDPPPGSPGPGSIGGPPPPDPSGRPGLPWDRIDQLGYTTAALETTKLVLTAPTEAFAQMRLSGGIGGPLLYAAALGTVGTIISSIWQIAVVVILPRFGLDGGSGSNPFSGGIGSPVMFQVASTVVFMVLSPVMIAAALFFNAAIVHVSALVFGADKNGFEATFRALAFAQGSCWPLNLVPFLGALIAGIWSLVCSVIGMSQAHGISNGKATLVILAPVALCCVCIAVPLGMFAAAGAAAYLGHH